jgi:hypothetical protein
MRLSNGVALGLAACLAGPAAALAAERFASSGPLDYVRVCNSSGAAFFVVPGAVSCRPPGGSGVSSQHRFGPRTIAGNANSCDEDIAREARGFVTGPSRATSRTGGGEGSPPDDFSGPVALPRKGSLSFLEADPIWTSTRRGGRRAATHSRAYSAAFVDDAFIKFAGFAAGLSTTVPADMPECAKSFGFDKVVGSLAYTGTFGAGFPTWIAFADRSSEYPARIGTIASWPEADPISINGISAPSFRSGSGVQEVSEIVGDFRGTRNWGGVQVDAAAVPVHAGLFTNQALAAPSPAYPIPPLPGNSYGLAGQTGVQPNMDYLSPGDRLWLQAAYENRSYGAVAGGGSGSISSTADAGRAGRAVIAPLDSVYGWRPQPNADCVWTGNFTCEPRRDRENGADASKDNSKRYSLPTFSSAGFSASPDVRYPPAATAGFGGAIGLPKFEDQRGGPSFVGMPIGGFNIGAEFMYIDAKQSRRVDAPANVVAPTDSAAPAAAGNPAEHQGRLRVQRAF